LLSNVVDNIVKFTQFSCYHSVTDTRLLTAAYCVVINDCH